MNYYGRHLVAMMPPLAQFLREYEQERRSIYRELGKKLSLDDLVFSTIEGKPLDPGLLSHSFARIVRSAGLQDVRFHRFKV